MSRSASSLVDTIVARATPPGEGAVAIVRLSGPDARKIASALAPGVRVSHRLQRARLVHSRVLDEAMMVEMHAPRSYTGEDVVEFHLHGSRGIVAAVLQACEALGARAANPGEFTLRAFLNGRLDLAQAEAVGDLIASSNTSQAALATAQLQGGLSDKISSCIHDLESVLGAWRAALDFPEHPTGPGWMVEHAARLAEARGRIQGLLESARVDAMRSRRIVLWGAPNVGKSSLINAWLGERRVLVDDAPGTTRDPVDVELRPGVSLCDTAGIHAAATGLELQGIEMTRARVRQADLALWIVSPDAPEWPDLAEGFVVGGKADVASLARRHEVEAEAQRRGLRFWGWVSTKSEEGLAALRAWLLGDQAPIEEGVVVRERHLEALRRANTALGRLNEALAQQGTLDVLSIELEDAVKNLGAILGRDVDAEVLDRIFADFCIGK